MSLVMNCSVSRGNFTLNANLSAPNNAVTAIVGPNGSGKTTTLMLVAGLLACTSGSIALDDTVFDAAESDPGIFLQPERRDVGMVFQDGALFSHLSALDNVAFGLRARGEKKNDARQRGISMLEQFGMGDYLRTLPHEMSGGQRQRVSVARALSASPTVLLADEPTSAIDQSAQAQLLKLFLGLLNDGLSIVLVSHDLGVIRYLTKRVYVMKDGVFVESGDTETVFNDPQEDYTKMLLASIPGELGKAARAKLKK